MPHDGSPCAPQIHAGKDIASSYQDILMANTNTPRTRGAQNRRRKLAKSSIAIPRHSKLRTLKRSARKHLEKERAARLWILPPVETLFSRPQTTIYPRTSLLGLPAELRQQILYESYTTVELIQDLEDLKSGARKRLDGVAWLADMARWQRIFEYKMQQYRSEPYEAELATVLKIKVAVLGRISSLILGDMEYVRKRWQRDLDAYVAQRRKEEEERARLMAVNVNPPAYIVGSWTGRRNGAVISAKGQRSDKKFRPQKCWYCMERHKSSDPVCPMETRDPEKWQQMTRVVGGKRAKARAVTGFKANGVLFTGKKMVFRDRGLRI